jgi:succinyl-CoA synthetase alpha subunit
MIGEIGGPDETEAAEWCKLNINLSSASSLA